MSVFLEVEPHPPGVRLLLLGSKVEAPSAGDWTTEHGGWPSCPAA